VGRRRRLLLALTAVVVGGALSIGLLVGSPDGGEGGAQVTPVAKRKAAPELDGEWLVPPPVRLAELRGQLVVVNFWASWCVPCREEAPDLARFDREMRGKAVLIGVDVQDARRDARAFIREFGWRFRNVRDPRGMLGERYRLVGLPTTFLIDRNGRIARTLAGPQSYEKLVAAVREVW
jgi:cytochrome c biogenesis protein CcmG/thiol:disulfide interchange protein DsbE